MFLSPPSQSTFTKLTAFGTIVTRLSLPKFCVRRSEYGSTQMTCWAPWFRKNWAVSPFPAPTSRTVPSRPSLGRYTRCHCFNSSFRIFLWGGSSFRFAKSGYSHIVSASYLTADNRIQCLISAILAWIHMYQNKDFRHRSVLLQLHDLVFDSGSLRRLGLGSFGRFVTC